MHSNKAKAPKVIFVEQVISLLTNVLLCHFDDKGLYWETAQKVFKKRGFEQKLILLKLHEADKTCINFLDFQVAPASTYAKILCDVAKTCGQESANDGFFATQSQIYIEYFLELCRFFPEEVNLADAFGFFQNPKSFLEKHSDKTEIITEKFEPLWSQPAQQLGGVVGNIQNYLFPFKKRKIVNLIGSKSPKNNLIEMDQGKVICIALPAPLEAERRYIHTLLKMRFYLHALARFGRTAEQRKQDNLLVFFADEAQQIMNASSSAGLNDHEVVAKIREARATVVAATQSYLSLIPAMKDEVRAKVLMANLANRVSFQAADWEGARVLSESLGMKKVWKGRINGVSRYEEEAWLKPEQLRNLGRFRAVVQHCEKGARVAKLTPL